MSAAVQSFVRIVRAVSAKHTREARALFLEYASDLGVDLCFQGLAEELANLPGAYAPPGGALFLAEVRGRLAGCVAVRKLGPGVCEMKRMYVRMPFRGRGIGRALALAVVEEARRLGYRAMRLDSLPHMVPALALYESLGFRRTRAHYRNPLSRVVYMKLELESSLGAASKGRATARPAAGRRTRKNALPK